MESVNDSLDEILTPVILDTDKVLLSSPNNLVTETVSNGELVVEQKDATQGGVESIQSAGEKSEESTEVKNLSSFEVDENSEVFTYWNNVRKDPSNFPAWTNLLFVVNEGDDVNIARKAYDSFFMRYPYCYGYWRKYAEYERKKGSPDECLQVYHRGLKAIPLSVDLWLHYVQYCKTIMSEEEIREQFIKAIDACGMEFKSDTLWDCFIKWETALGVVRNVSKIYDKLLQTPTQGYDVHFQKYKYFVESHSGYDLVDLDEYSKLLKDALKEMVPQLSSSVSSVSPKDTKNEIAVVENPSENANVCNDEAVVSSQLTKVEDASGEDVGSNEDCLSSESNDNCVFPLNLAESIQLDDMIKKKILSIRKKFFEKNEAEVSARLAFEKSITRPYFHVKPLEQYQLASWIEYLEFEMGRGNKDRIIFLFERCLIACASYVDFWMKFIKYLDTQPITEVEALTRHTYERGCVIHHPDKVLIWLGWASFEESLGNIENARQVLLKLENKFPQLLTVTLSRINLERRNGNLQEADDLFKCHLSRAKNIIHHLSLVIKYYKFAWKVLKDYRKAADILYDAIKSYPENIRLYFVLIDLLMSVEGNHEAECLSLFNQMLLSDKILVKEKVRVSQRKLEFMEEYCSSCREKYQAQLEYSHYLKESKTNPDMKNKKNDNVVPPKKPKLETHVHSEKKLKLNYEPSQSLYATSDQLFYNNNQWSYLNTGNPHSFSNNSNHLGNYYYRHHHHS